MKAADVAARLGSARRAGSNWRCVCPLHGGRSLLLRDGRDGRLLVACMGGCESADVLRELNRLQLTDFNERDPYDQRDFDREIADEKDSELAVKIWQAATPAERAPPIARYLQSRGISLRPPSTLRWSPSCWHPDTKRTGIKCAAMIGRVDNVDGEIIGIHRTYLSPDGSGKVPGIQDKAFLGPIKGGAMRLGAIEPERALIVGEGLETVLSLMQLRRLPGWSALSAPGLRALVLPQSVRRVLVAVDHDRGGAGEAAARDAAARWISEGREVRLAIPARRGDDWNDVLRGRANG